MVKMWIIKINKKILFLILFIIIVLAFISIYLIKAQSETQQIQNTPPPTPTPIIEIRQKDNMEMVFVSEGAFKMGSNHKENDWDYPEHLVFLDSFWIDKYEVTNEQYVKFLNANHYSKDNDTWIEIKSHFSDSLNIFDRLNYNSETKVWQTIVGWEKHPVVNVTWYGADSYCKWIGGRFPTEAEWEKAARGTDGRNYPWGNQTPNEKLLNYGDSIGSTTEVDAYPNGVSPYGAMDMEGNVWEFVSDWMNREYYQISPINNPKGPEDGEIKAIRGSSWGTPVFYIRSTNRQYIYPNTGYDNYGFRCVVEP